MATSTFINTLVTTEQSLSAAFDDLLVTTSGAIVVTDGSDGVESSAAGQEITIDGLVYSVDDDSGAGVYLNSSGTTLVVNGQVQGDKGMWANGATRVSISVGSQGSIDGVDNFGVYFLGNPLSPAATEDFLSNAGDIAVPIYASGVSSSGVAVGYGGDDTINNSGKISGTIAVSLFDNVAKETIENSGAIAGGAGSTGSAIHSGASSAGIAIINSGLITDGATNAIGGSYALIYFNDKSGTTSTIDNKGTIAGSGYVIQSQSDILDIANSGTIHGGLYSKAQVDADNAGLWKGQAGSAVTVFHLSGASNSITNSQLGAIDGAISIGGSGDTIDNAGKIDGAITLLSGSDTFTNTGDIDGAVAFTGGGATNNVTNSGKITGNFTFSGENSELISSGAITGTIRLTAVDVLDNDGQIHGSVFASTGDILYNYGGIDGSLTLGASDTLVATGDVKGGISASTNDFFDFGGNFGNVTISNFAAGSGSTHDTIRFATNDFGTFSQVQKASSQQGSDVVIRLDGTDTITLAGVTLSSLVSADFKFV